MPRASLLLAALLSVPAVAAPPEEDQEIAPGARVRVETRGADGPARTLKGTLSAFDGQRVILATKDGEAMVEIPRASVTRVELSKGKRSHRARGALIGAAAVGIAFAVATGLGDGCRGERSPSGELLLLPCLKVDVATAGTTGAGLGAVLGTLVGHFVRTEGWSEVPLDRIHLTVAPVRGGGGLALSVRF